VKQDAVERKVDSDERRSHVRIEPENFEKAYSIAVQEDPMPQVKLRVNAQFERDLFTIMETMQIVSKSQAIRFAVREAAEAFRTYEARNAASLNAGSGASR